MKRKIKICVNGSRKNDPEIMPDPPVKYLQNDKHNQIYQILIITFNYVTDFNHVKIIIKLNDIKEL